MADRSPVRKRAGAFSTPNGGTVVDTQVVAIPTFALDDVLVHLEDTDDKATFSKAEFSKAFKKAEKAAAKAAEKEKKEKEKAAEKEKKAMEKGRKKAKEYTKSATMSIIAVLDILESSDLSDLSDQCKILLTLDGNFDAFVAELHKILPALEGSLEGNKKHVKLYNSIKDWHDLCWDEAAGKPKEMEQIRQEVLVRNLEKMGQVF